DGRTGYLVPAGEVAPLAERLTAVLQDEAGRRRTGAAARAIVEREFSWRRAIEATIDVYREIVTSP
ncbi:MAG TPA: glycosyltransferase family 1 protein, partial [Chloroflexota bacterium]|nr:glycosyltransferase family 1 protein [Chloroflexota bacterium]